MTTTRTTRSTGTRETTAIKKEPLEETSVKAPTKRKRAALVKSEEDDSIPHNLGSLHKVEDDSDRKPAKSRTNAARKKGPSKADLEAGASLAASIADSKDTLLESPSKKAKTNSYNLNPGQSPYPDYAHPTPKECEEVNRILSKAHGKVSAPKTIPTPSLNSSGCGEVPSVLDALVRTRLSAATNNANSSRAFRGLVEKFGIIKKGTGKGSVDWNKVRRSNVADVFEAIKTGGLAGVKSKDIKSILDMVADENKADREKDGVKDEEDAEHPLSLDHLHALSSDEAFAHLVRYPGIGPKTASCVLLFCLQRPSFAVDTHVFRLTTWLGWVPNDKQVRAMAKKGKVKAPDADESSVKVEETSSGKKVRIPPVTRNSTYAHLDVRVPDDLKYSLHYLLIRHGKDCGWCSAKAGAAKKVGVCPLAHLMSGKGRNKGAAKKGIDESEDEGDEDSESSVGSDVEVDD